MRAEDFAQAIELKEYENTQRRAIQPKRQPLSNCQDCGEEIPVERQKDAAATRCITCQQDFESLEKRRNHG